MKGLWEAIVSLSQALDWTKKMLSPTQLQCLYSLTQQLPSLPDTFAILSSV